MKKVLAYTLAAGLGLLVGTSGTAQAENVGRLVPASPVVPEMSNARGKIVGDLEAGRFKVVVDGLPVNANGNAVPNQLSDLTLGRGAEFDVESYEVSLLSVTDVGGEWLIRGAFSGGKLRLGKNGHGHAMVKGGGDLSGFNIAVVTAEQDRAGHRWRMSEEIGRSFSSAETSGVIVLWGQIAEIRGEE